MSLKAHVKINVIVHVEGGSSEEAAKTKYPLAAHCAGVVEVSNVEEGERLVEMVRNHVASMFRNLSVEVVKGGHKPDLAAAMGGDQEPTREGNGAST